MKKYNAAELTELHDCVDQALAYDWDPIGQPLPPDEYGEYVPEVVNLVVSEAGASAIAEHLLSTERNRMGLTRDWYHENRAEICHRVAMRLVADWEYIRLKHGG